MRIGLSLLAGLLLAGCSSSPAVDPNAGDGAGSIAWPPSSGAERIRYVEAISNPGDLGIRPSMFRRFMDALAGDKDMSMIRPYAVSVRGPKILVGDPGAHAVYFF